MSDELLPYYNRELAFIRKMAGQFAEANPKIAGRLRLSAEVVEDPHVARMIEAFAYLNARTRHKVEDDFPEITHAMLGVLYPHYLAPFPSAAIIQFALDPSQAELIGGYDVSRGATVETEPIDGQPCRFQTCYPVRCWPIKIAAATYRGQPCPAPSTRFSSAAQSVVRLELEAWSSKVKFKQFKLGRLRFFLKGQAQYINLLYELLLNNRLGMAIAKAPDDPAPVLLPVESLVPVGFDRDEGLLPYPARSFLGYRLLSEYFMFPEKYLFVDVLGLTPDVLGRFETNRLELYFYLDRYEQDLESNVATDSFQLGCTPMVNLFRQRAEPIQLNHTTHEYRVVPDARRPLAHEVYAVNRVVATSPANEELEYLPFYSIRHGESTGPGQAFWYATRRPSEYAGGQFDRASEVTLSVVDLGFKPSLSADWTLDVETTCLNRNLPARLPFGGGQPYLQLASGGPLARIRCLTAPTPTRRPALRHGTMWRLISHLSLNHLSLVDADDGASALREILKLYDFADSAESRASIEGLLGLDYKRVVGRVGGSVAAGFCRGVEVTLHLNEEKFTGGGIYLFASVLDRFLGLYSSINSFTRTVVTTNRREAPLCRWAPRAGERVLI